VRQSFNIEKPDEPETNDKVSDQSSFKSSASSV
jgi:hypothetical protein